MSSSDYAAPEVKRRGVAFPEFVLLIAMLMGVSSFGMVGILPALPLIKECLGLTFANQQQWLVSAFLIGMSAPQIFYGPIADRFGRRIPMLACLALFIISSFLASIATSFSIMILARLLQGVAAAGVRVLPIAMVRDKFQGSEMARVMSFATIVFLAMPMLAPIIGAWVMKLASWRAIFLSSGAFALIIGTWILLRVPETMQPHMRRSMDPRVLLQGFRTFLTNRTSIGYSLAFTMTFGALFGFISSGQQIFASVFHIAPDKFPLYFALISVGSVFACLINSSIVVRFGSRRMAHWGVVLFLLMTLTHAASALLFGETLNSFIGFEGATLFFITLLGTNFSATAMEPMGALAGTAAAFQGTISTLGGAVIGTVIGQSFSGNIWSIVLGNLACSICAISLVAFAERGRLFRAPQPKAC